MTNAEAMAAIAARVNDRVADPGFDAGPPAAWGNGKKAARLGELNGLLLYTIGDNGAAHVVHHGLGEATEHDISAAAEAIVAHLEPAAQLYG